MQIRYVCIQLLQKHLQLLKLIFSTIELQDTVEKQLYAAFTLKIDKER